MNVKTGMVLACLIGLVSVVGIAWGQSVPQTINYQGRLADSGGVAVDATVPMEFKITDMLLEQDAVVDEPHTLFGTTPETLTFDDLLPGLEVVTDQSGNTIYANGIDYFIDYGGGTIQRVGSGSIPNPGGILIDYEYNTDITVLWSETATVSVSQGLYNVALGSSNPIPISVFSGPERYLEVTVDGELLSPRQPLTSVAYSMVAERAETVPDGAIGTDQLALDAVTSDKIKNNSITGDDILNDSVGTGDIADGSLTGDDIQNGSITSSDIKDEYVLNSGDTVTGPLRIEGGLGLNTEPASGYGIINDSVAAPSIGAWLYGSMAALYGLWSPDPFNHYAYLGSEQYGVYARNGNSDDTGSQYGGYFDASGQELVYGLYGVANGYSTDSAYGIAATSYNSGSGNAYGGYFLSGSQGTGEHYGARGSAYGNSDTETAYGLYGYGSNSSSGDAYGGYFTTSASGAGSHYGVYGASDQVGVRGAWADDPDDHYAHLGTRNSGIYAVSGGSDEVESRYGGNFNARSQAFAYGVRARADGYGGAMTYGVYGEAYNYGSSSSYGGLFISYQSGTGDHYGIAAQGNADSAAETAYGVWGLANNTSTADAYGGYFIATDNGSGNHYGVYGESDDHGVYGVWTGTTADNIGYLGGDTYGVYGLAGSSVLLSSVAGGYFEARSARTPYGVKAVSRNYGTGYAYGGHFSAIGNGSATSRAIYASATGAFSGGNIALYAKVDSAGDYALYAPTGQKSWVNPDPEDSTKSIVYVTLEGGISGTYHAGRAQLDKGRIKVVLPDHFRKVTSPDENVMVTVTPRGQCNGLMVTQSDNAGFIVEELSHGTSSVEFDFIVMGYRLGYEDYEPIRENLDYIPFEGNLADMGNSEMTSQEYYDNMDENIKKILIKNGTLDEQGKIDQARFSANGWKVVSKKEKK